MCIPLLSLINVASVSRQATDAELGDDLDEGDKVRHAETPELAREALVDSVVLIFKSQVEVAFREQTAGHNALLLFVHLVLQMMEEQLQNSSRELAAKQAEVCCVLAIMTLPKSCTFGVLLLEQQKLHSWHLGHGSYHYQKMCQRLAACGSKSSSSVR